MYIKDDNNDDCFDNDEDKHYAKMIPMLMTMMMITNTKGIEKARKYSLDLFRYLTQQPVQLSVLQWNFHHFCLLHSPFPCSIVLSSFRHFHLVRFTATAAIFIDDIMRYSSIRHFSSTSFTFALHHFFCFS
jgi:hypothetical protein